MLGFEPGSATYVDTVTLGPMSDMVHTRSITYHLFHNETSRYGRSYLPGDRLRLGYLGVLAHSSHDLLDLAGKVFVIHNSDDRPDGMVEPSLSVGDVVVLAECAVSVAPIGFVVVELRHSDIFDAREHIGVEEGT